MICVNLIDKNILYKILLWLKEKQTIDEDYSKLFQQIDVSASSNYCSEDCQSNIEHENLSYMFPFIESWQDDTADGVLKITRDNPFKSMSNDGTDTITQQTRQRGKWMNPERGATTDRPFECEFRGCKRAFKRLGHLRRHQKMHTGECPFECTFPGCTKSFSRSDNLNSLSKIHTQGEKKKGYSLSSEKINS